MNGRKCFYCQQRIKRRTPRAPVKHADVVIGYSHPGCALRGSNNNDPAAQRRAVVTGRPTT